MWSAQRGRQQRYAFVWTSESCCTNNTATSMRSNRIATGYRRNLRCNSSPTVFVRSSNVRPPAWLCQHCKHRRFLNNWAQSRCTYRMLFWRHVTHAFGRFNLFWRLAAAWPTKTACRRWQFPHIIDNAHPLSSRLQQFNDDQFNHCVIQANLNGAAHLTTGFSPISSKPISPSPAHFFTFMAYSWCLFTLFSVHIQLYPSPLN